MLDRFSSDDTREINPTASLISTTDFGRPTQLVQMRGGCCRVYPTKRDGNCLFYAIAHQAFPCAMNSIEHEKIAELLRKKVVLFLRQNMDDSRCRAVMLDRIGNDFPALSGLTIKESIDGFLSSLSDPRSGVEPNLF